MGTAYCAPINRGGQSRSGSLAYVANPYKCTAVVRTFEGRVEVRAAETELATWRDAANARRQNLSEYIRDAVNVMAAPSVHRAFIERVRGMIINYEKQGGTSGSGAILLTKAEEYALMAAGPGDLGPERLGTLTVEGPQAAFPKLFGYAVHYGAHQFMITSAR